MKPKYNFFKNSKFAFEGLAAMLKNEMAFRFELCIIVPLALVSLFLPVSAAQHALLIAVFGLVFDLRVLKYRDRSGSGPCFARFSSASQNRQKPRGQLSVAHRREAAK